MSKEMDKLGYKVVERRVESWRLQSVPTVLTELVEGIHGTLRRTETWPQFVVMTQPNIADLFLKRLTSTRKHVGTGQNQRDISFPVNFDVEQSHFVRE